MARIATVLREREIDAELDAIAAGQDEAADAATEENE